MFSLASFEVQACPKYEKSERQCQNSHVCSNRRRFACMPRNFAFWLSGFSNNCCCSWKMSQFTVIKCFLSQLTGMALTKSLSKRFRSDHLNRLPGHQSNTLKWMLSERNASLRYHDGFEGDQIGCHPISPIFLAKWFACRPVYKAPLPPT